MGFVWGESGHNSFVKYPIKYDSVRDTVGTKVNITELETEKPNGPSNILKEVMNLLQLEKVKFSLRGNVNTFQVIWQPFIDHFEKTKL